MKNQNLTEIFKNENWEINQFFERFTRLLMKYLFVFILLYITVLQSHGQNDVKAKDIRIISKIDSTFSFIASNEPGCTIGIIEDGSMTYQMNYGLASIEWDQAISSSVKFNIGSISKQFTATAIILLAKDSILSLDDDIRKWIPEIPDYGFKIIIKNLLHHTSGLRDYQDLQVITGKPYVDIFNEEDGIKLLSKQKSLNFEPGEKFEYSNSGYLLLAAIVRRTSGKSLREYCQEKIFKPLKMEHSQFWDNHQDIISMMATGYKKTPDGFKVFQIKNDEVVGDGNLITTVSDLALWDKNFYTKELGGDYLFNQMHTCGILNNNEETSYACGLEFEKHNGLNTIGHGGSTPGFLSYYVRFPDKNTSIILLNNRSDIDAGTYVNKIADILFFKDSQESNTIESVSSDEINITYEKTFIPTLQTINDWKGTYRRENPTSYIIIESLNDKLFLGFLNISLPITLKSNSIGEVEDLESKLELNKSPDNKNYELVINHGKPRYKVELPTINDLKPYTGMFKSDELNVEYEIIMKDNDLFLLIPNYEPQKLNSGKKNELFFLEWIIEFKQDKNGVILGFILNTGRVSDIEFVKKENLAKGNNFR